MFTKKKTPHHEPVASKAPHADGDVSSTETVAPAENTGVAETPVEEQPAAASEEPSKDAQELAAMKDRYTRLMADFDNYRKRQTREREELIKRANEDLLSDLLPVIDHLELALAQDVDHKAPFVAGVKLVYDQFIALLERYGMKPFDTKGEPFDPTYHEALSQMSSDTVPANLIIDQFRRGWLLGGKLLRPAQVIVSSGAPDEETAEAESESVSD